MMIPSPGGSAGGLVPAPPCTKGSDAKFLLNDKKKKQRKEEPKPKPEHEEKAQENFTYDKTPVLRLA
jgi:hypothetical protein